MNTFSAICAAAVFSALSASAIAAPLSSKAVADLGAPLVTRVDFVQGHETLAGVEARSAVARASMSGAMAQRYFDADMFVTLGALALASGAFVAAGIAGSRRRPAPVAVGVSRDDWRNGVMQALEDDLSHFAMDFQKAA